MIAAYMSMARSIESMGLEGVWDLKPMFNGGEIKKILPQIPRGPAFSNVMAVSGYFRNPSTLSFQCVCFRSSLSRSPGICCGSYVLLSAPSLKSATYKS